jgi:diaminohydroxyphosphoribosylaminopyrimidine deaminase/5-amino-6-(5-phosphoribosylamino)uracil reductase
MLRCLELARQAHGRTWPNPMVGCVLVRDGRVLAEGFHRRAGDDHAEADALRRVDFQAAGATLHVNLEPCCHWGRTPPCTDAILRAGVRRVVVGMLDPNPLVAGRGVEALRAAGVEVELGVHEAACQALNEVHSVLVSRGRPFVTLKAAVTLDGRTATRGGRSQWITGNSARAHARRERALHGAVLVGSGTVLADDPSLTQRSAAPDLPEPLRVVLDGRLRMPPTARMLREPGGGQVLVLCGEAALATPGAGTRATALREAGAEVVAAGDGESVELPRALELLRQRGVAAILVEGGSQVHGAFADARIVDRWMVYVAPKVFGGRDASPLLGGLGVEQPEDAAALLPFEVTRLGPDLLLETRPLDGPAAAAWGGARGLGETR